VTNINASTPTLPAALNAPPNGTAVLPPASLLNYSILADGGLGFIDVVNHKSDFERRVLPLQWSLDSVRNLILLSRYPIHGTFCTRHPLMANFTVTPSLHCSGR
jgi:hypothetical protein